MSVTMRVRYQRLYEIIGGRLGSSVRRPTLCYHAFSDTRDDFNEFIFDVKSIAELRADLAFLAECFGFVDPDEALSGGKGRGVLLTFDDGYREWSTSIAAELAAFGARAIFFVTTGIFEPGFVMPLHKLSYAIARIVDLSQDQLETVLERLRSHFPGPSSVSRDALVAYMNANWESDVADVVLSVVQSVTPVYPLSKAAADRYLDEAGVRSLRDGGHIIGAHGVDHANLNRATYAELKSQIEESVGRICDIAGSATAPFAFPYSCRRDSHAMKSVRNECPQVSAFFGTGGLLARIPEVTERIVCDRKYPGANGAAQSLKISLGRAMAIQAYRTVADVVRRPRAGNGGIAW